MTTLLTVTQQDWVMPVFGIACYILGIWRGYQHKSREVKQRNKIGPC